MALFPIQHVSYPYHISTAFSPAVIGPEEYTNGSSRRTSFSSPYKPTVGLDPNIEMLDTIQVVDYRYLRFALDPRTGLFSIIRFVSYHWYGRTEADHIRCLETGEILLGKTSPRFRTGSVNL